MRILAVDTGTGTQDILLLDTRELVENSVKMVAPSPTLKVAGRIREAAAPASHFSHLTSAFHTIDPPSQITELPERVPWGLPACA